MTRQKKLEWLEGPEPEPDCPPFHVCTRCASPEMIAYENGAEWMRKAILAFLRGYPNAGGDTEVMTEVERIAFEARRDGEVENARNSRP